MTPDRFWELVATLGGHVDDARAEALEDRLAADEGGPFGEAVQEHVDRLLQRCPVPPSHGGDAAEWMAAAVVAAGREIYERTLAAGTTLHPDAWDWEDAEALLVVGHDELDPGSAGEDGHWQGGTSELPVTFQWRSLRVAPGVLTVWDEVSAAVQDELGTGVDPAWGRIPAVDPHFVEVVEAHARPAAAVERHVVVSDDVVEPTWQLFPEAGDPEHVVLSVPPDPLLAVEDRRPLYRELVEALDAAVSEVPEVPEVAGPAPDAG